MKLQVQCDKCGAIGPPAHIHTDYDGRDLCDACGVALKLEAWKLDYAHKLEWLESTHLKDLRELKHRIESVEAAQPQQFMKMDTRFTDVDLYWPGGSEWTPIEALDRKEMQFVLVTDGDVVRLRLWNPYQNRWEPEPPRMGALTIEDDCTEPTHFMAIPSLPNDGGQP